MELIINAFKLALSDNKKKNKLFDFFESKDGIVRTDKFYQYIL